MYLEKDFLDAISTSFKKYLEYLARSTEKIKPLYAFWAKYLKNVFGNACVRRRIKRIYH